MKSNTQNAKIEAITEKTLVLGIDVGSETHYARAFDYRGIEYSKKPFKFSNTEAGFVTFKEWILDIKERHEKDKVVPGMEPTGHYWFNLGKFLQDNEMKPVLVNPHHVKKTKELDDNNPTKNDRKDPKVIAGLVREGRYMIPYLPDGVYADLRTASNIRFQLQAELTRIQNRIRRWFNIYFPEYKTVYGKPDAKSGMLILKAAPLPEDILTLGIDGVNQIWRDAKLRAVGKARAKILIENSIGNRNMNDLEQGKYDGYRDIFDLLDEVKQMKFKKGDKVFHKNLKLFGIFVDYAWENPNEEADVDFEMEDGYIEQRHVSINQLQKYPSNEEIGKRLEGITVDELRIKIEQLIEDLENETVNRNMNDMEEGRYKTLCEVLDLIDEQKK